MMEHFVDPGMIIKHKRSKDVAFLIHSVHGKWIYGEWLNLGFVESWRINEYQGLDIYDNLRDWQGAVDVAPCLRDVMWLDLA